MTLSQVETVALGKITSTAGLSAARDGLSAGVHFVDVVVRVSGTLTVAEDTDKVPTVSIPLKEVLALFVARSGCTRAASLALLAECMTEALAGGGVSGVGAVEAAADIDAAFKASVGALLAALPRTKVRGAVKVGLVIEVIPDEVAIAAK